MNIEYQYDINFKYAYSYIYIYSYDIFTGMILIISLDIYHVCII